MKWIVGLLLFFIVAIIGATFLLWKLHWYIAEKEDEADDNT